MQRKVAITGIGMMTAIGLTASECWKNAIDAVSGIGKITKFDAGDCQTQIGAEIPSAFTRMENQQLSKRFIKQSVKATRLIKMCAKEAIEDSGLELDLVQKNKCAVIMGTSGSSVRSPEDNHNRSTDKFKIIREMINALPAWVTLDTGFGGPSFTVSAGACSGAAAMVSASELILNNAADVVIVGAADTLLTRNFIRRANSLGLLTKNNQDSQDAVKAYDTTRDGFVLGDGGAVLVLESLSHAVSRNASIYACLEGYGFVRDYFAGETAFANAQAMKHTMQYALYSAEVSKEQIDYINGEGNATVFGDGCEVEAIQDLFGSHAKKLLINSTKPILGHTIGASGVIDAGFTAMCLYHRKVFPVRNLNKPEPEWQPDFISGTFRDTPDLSLAMSNTFDFSGQFYSLVFSNTGSDIAQ